jgi:hypothetical protein
VARRSIAMLSQRAEQDDLRQFGVRFDVVASSPLYRNGLIERARESPATSRSSRMARCGCAAAFRGWTG